MRVANFPRAVSTHTFRHPASLAARYTAQTPRYLITYIYNIIADTQQSWTRASHRKTEAGKCAEQLDSSVWWMLNHRATNFPIAITPTYISYPTDSYMMRPKNWGPRKAISGIGNGLHFELLWNFLCSNMETKNWFYGFLFTELKSSNGNYFNQYLQSPLSKRCKKKN